MTKGIVFLFSVVLVINNCKTKAQSDKRKEIITEFISAVENYDTMRLFVIVDTSEYFGVQDKEGFLYQIDYLRTQFKKCGNVVLDSAIRIHHRDIPFTDYTYVFCRGKKGEIIDDSFDIQFTFADFDSKASTHFINVKKYKQNVSPTNPPPAQ